MNNILEKFHAVFQTPKPVIGMIHLPPLPGAPLYDGADMAGVAKTAAAEAKTLKEAGFDGIIVENYGDVMFNKRAKADTVAALTYVTKEIKDHVDMPMGVCVLQSDGIAGLAIAHVVGAEFIRVPYYTETYVVDAGLMESTAAGILRYRKFLGAEVLIFADVHIKHGYPLSQRPIEEAAEDACHRGLADALIVTGKKTGWATNPEDVAKVKKAVGNWPVLVGSGVSLDNLGQTMQYADGAIVGTSIKMDNDTNKPVDPQKARALAAAVHKFAEQ